MTTLLLIVGSGALLPRPVEGQLVPVGELTHLESEVPLRLMGYGLVVGLEGTGDRALGGRAGSGFTVRSVANLLRRFEIEIPEDLLRTRNVAAVLVTAEASPWLRPGGRFPVQVSSLGDATSLQGGVLWMTPLVTDPDGPPMATAQGPLTVAGEDRRGTGRYRGGTSGEIPEGGVMEAHRPGSMPSQGMRLFLKQPDAVTAERIAIALNEAFGEGSATMEDPGSVLITGENGVPSIGEIRSVPVEVRAIPTILVDSRAGTVVAGGGIRIGASVVSHGGLTIAIEPPGPEEPTEAPRAGEVRLTEGASVQEVVAALHAAGASSREITAILRGFREVRALQAEVVVR